MPQYLIECSVLCANHTMHGKGGKGKKLMWSPLYEVLVTCYLLPGSAGESRLVFGYQCARANRCDHLPPKQHRTYTSDSSMHTLLSKNGIIMPCSRVNDRHPTIGDAHNSSAM